MTHLDPELLALLALGEDAASPDALAHLEACEACREEVRRYACAVRAGRSDTEPLVAPQPRVWEGIVATLGLDGNAAAVGPLDRGSRPGRRPVRRRPTRRVVLVAALALVLVAGGVAAGLTIAGQAQQVATATLEAFPDWRGDHGTAVLERLPDGREVVEVRTTVRPSDVADHEVWLMTDGAKQLVSLGLLHGTAGTFAVPAGLDLDRYRLVDVSQEPRDGNPAHSGDSIIRGALQS